MARRSSVRRLGERTIGLLATSLAVTILMGATPAVSQERRSFDATAKNYCGNHRVDVIVSEKNDFTCSNITAILDQRRRDADTRLMSFKDDDGLYYLSLVNRVGQTETFPVSTELLRRMEPYRNLSWQGMMSRRASREVFQLRTNGVFARVRGLRSSRTFGFFLGLFDKPVRSLAELDRMHPERKRPSLTPIRGRRTRTAEQNAILDARQSAKAEAMKRATEPPNRYPSHMNGKATTALVDGNIERFDKLVGPGFAAQYYWYFSLRYTEKCLKSPRRRGSWTEKHTETKRDRFGNVVSKRSIGSSTYTVEKSELSIARDMGDRFGGFYHPISKNMRSFISSNSCNSKEVQNVRRVLYRYGREVVSGAR